MGERPYSYIESLPSKFDDKDLKDQIRFQISKNNVKQPKHKSKKKVFNPMAILLMDPVLGASAWARKAKYNKKIADGRLDEVTDAERLEFESKADPNRGFFERLNPEKLIPRDTKKEIDTIGDIATGAVTGIPLGVKSLAEFLTIGADYKFDTNFTEALDKKTREFLKYTGEPETLAGEITQLGTQFLVPMKIIDKIIGRIGKLKYLKDLFNPQQILLKG